MWWREEKKWSHAQTNHLPRPELALSLLTRPSETHSPRDKQTQLKTKRAATVAAINPAPSKQTRSSRSHNMERLLRELPRRPRLPDLLAKCTTYRSITKSLGLFGCKNPKEETVLVDSNRCSGFKLLHHFYLDL